MTSQQQWSSDFFQDYPYPSQQDYLTKFDLEHQPTLVYPVSPFYTTSPSASPSSNIMYVNEPFIADPATFPLNQQQHHGPGSPDSLMSGLSSNASASAAVFSTHPAPTTAPGVLHHPLPPPPAYQHPVVPPPLVQSNSSSTIHSANTMSTTPSPQPMVAAAAVTAAVAKTTAPTTSSAAAAAYLNETIAKASALPESFYPEFLQYSKESFEQSASQRSNSNSRKRARPTKSFASDNKDAKLQKDASPASSSDDDEDAVAEEEEEDDDDEDNRPTRKQKVEENASASVSELRRQIHIQSEQKRRAQIKDGFEDLRAELPTCLNKKMSKVNLLHKTVQHIKHLKSTQMTILAELERLVQENEQLRNFQRSVLQKQAFENMYTIGNI